MLRFFLLGVVDAGVVDRIQNHLKCYSLSAIQLRLDQWRIYFFTFTTLSCFHKRFGKMSAESEQEKMVIWSIDNFSPFVIKLLVDVALFSFWSFSLRLIYWPVPRFVFLFQMHTEMITRNKRKKTVFFLLNLPFASTAFSRGSRCLVFVCTCEHIGIPFTSIWWKWYLLMPICQ